MDRLTTRDKHGVAVMRLDLPWGTSLVARLAEYEDTGMTPEQIISELKADNSCLQEGFIRCGYVQFKKKFGEYLKPYIGCPRGAIGHRGLAAGEVPSIIGGIIADLEDSKDNVLIGPDEDYICIPKMWYDSCLEGLKKLQSEEKNDQLTPKEVAE